MKIKINSYIIIVWQFIMKNNSQTIGLFAKTDSFVPTEFPLIIDTADQTYKNIYLSSRNLLQTDMVPGKSVSALRYVQIFRIEERPTSVKDFSDALVAEKDLKLIERAD